MVKAVKLKHPHSAPQHAGKSLQQRAEMVVHMRKFPYQSYHSWLEALL